MPTAEVGVRLPAIHSRLPFSLPDSLSVWLIMRIARTAPWLLTLAFVATTPTLLEAQAVRQSGRSEAGMVAASHPLATDAGVRILEMGGNAADAAVATAFAIAIVEPTMNSIGGRNQILVRTANGEVHGIDGTTQAPWDYDHETAPQASFGYAVIGIPGALAGLIKLHEEHGSLSLAQVMQPAIEYAENGFRILPGDAARQAGGAEQALQFPGTAAAYYKGDGSPHRAGEILRQPDYAATLRKIMVGGHDVFYRGEIADAMVADFAANGAVIDKADLEQYVAEDSRIVRGTYRGYELIGTDVPAAGVLSIQALQIMETFDPGSMTEAEWFAIAGQSLRLAQRELAVLGTDAEAERATSKAYAAELALEIAAPGRAAAGVWTPMPELEARGDLYGGHTTHLSTADADGMVVSLTQTLGPSMGSKVVTPGLGFLYASTLGGYLGTMTQPGMRARSNINPFIVLKDGEGTDGPRGGRWWDDPPGGCTRYHPSHRLRHGPPLRAWTASRGWWLRRRIQRRDIPGHWLDRSGSGRNASTGNRRKSTATRRRIRSSARNSVRCHERHVDRRRRPGLGRDGPRPGLQRSLVVKRTGGPAQAR